MTKQEFKTEVRKLIGEAETEQALDLMLEFFGKNSAYLNLYNQTTSKGTFQSHGER